MMDTTEATGASFPKMDGQVHTELDMLHNSVGDLQATVNELRARLAPVLRDEPPQPECDVTKSPDEARVLVAQRTTDARRNVIDANSDLRGMLERLEV